MNRRIGEHYEVVRELQRGAWVTVYEARHDILGRRTLIKWLNPAFQEDEELVGRLRREARLGASVDHPNIARIYEVGDAEDRPYVAIEWIEGEDLDDVMAQEGPFSAKRTLRLAKDLLAGLSAIHTVGVVHRDLSPMNVRITPDGVARITDFGLATGPFDTHYTLPGSVVGTPGYLSPEQASGKSADERSDLFSCGTLIHEALSGQALFKDEDLIATLKQVRAKQAPPLEQEIEDLPAGFDEWLAKLLAKKADDRYASAKDALKALLNLTGETLKEAKEQRPAPKQVVRRATGWGAVAMAVILVLAGLLTLPSYLSKQSELEEQLPDIDSLRQLAQSEDTMNVEGDESREGVEEDPDLTPPPPAQSEREGAPLRTGSTGVDPGSPVQRADERGQTPEPEPEEADVDPDTLSPPPNGWLVIHSHPWADVYIEAQRVGATPGLMPFAHEEGLVHLTFDNPGFPPIPIETRVTAAETTRVLIELSDYVASLTLAASPWAKVYIDDTPVGETPIPRTLYLSPGSHLIRFIHPDFGTVDREVDVEPGDSLAINVEMKLEGTGFAPEESEEPR
ncbi:protein kinase [bacterium]|nr:protein kinase [bacterium]